MSENMFSELSRIIDQVGKDKGIDKQVIVDAVVQGMLVAARKKYGTYRDIEAQYNEESGEVELYEFKEVVTDEEFVDEEIEIKMSEAKELDPDAELHDSIGSKLESNDLGRIAAQTAKQIIMQKVRDAEREIIFNEFDQRKGEIASGIARRVERGSIVVDLGRTEAHIPLREQIPGEQYRPGDRIQGYISDVRQTTRGPQIIMSRADERYMVKLFEVEVPEVYDGIVQVMAAAREPGQRAKIAVESKDPAVDPVGACVGMKGSRVQNVVQELKGEKIDIVTYDEDPARFVCNGLAPAEISKVFVNETAREMEVVVPDAQLSLAIGKRGQNVRLAAKLTGWRLDIMSESSAAQKTAAAIFNLMLLPGMSDTMAQNIFQSGYSSVQELAIAEIDHVMLIPGYDDPEKAEKLVDDSNDLIQDYRKQGKELPTVSGKLPEAEEARATGDAQSQANQRLKEELAQLEADESVPAAASGENGASVEEPAAEESEPAVEAVAAEEGAAPTVVVDSGEAQETVKPQA